MTAQTVISAQQFNHVESYDAKKMTSVQCVEIWANGEKSRDYKIPYGEVGIFKTPAIVLCNDGKWRRVKCSATRSNYFLFVVVKGAKVTLAFDEFQPISWHNIQDLSTGRKN